MKNSVMTHKRLLGIDEDLNFLIRLENEISHRCPGCQFDKVTTFEDGRQLMLLLTYDLVISDPLNTPGSKLMDLAGGRNFPVLALSSNGASPRVAARFDKVRIPRVISKKGVKSLVPVIEEIVRLENEPRWMRLVKSRINFPSRAMMRMVPKNFARKFPWQYAAVLLIDWSCCMTVQMPPILILRLVT